MKSLWSHICHLRALLNAPLLGLFACLLLLVGAMLFPTTERLQLAFVGALAVGALVCGVAAVAQARRRSIAPLAHLLEVARAVIHGRPRVRIGPDLPGDFKMLAHALDQMIDARLAAEEKLRAAHDSLELKVAARTGELFRANKALRDESEQRTRAERDFHQAQKMEALGKLAGSIAHDFNNLLTVIIGGAEAVRRQLGENHKCVHTLKTVEQAGERAAGLTRPLLTFSRNQVAALEPLSLNTATEEAGRMLVRLLGANIDLRLQLAPNLQLVKANSNQIQQVLINLGVNARDAMEGVGILTFKTQNVRLSSEEQLRQNVAAADDWVEIAVSDTGTGMDAATKARIFEPFFTTKPAGKGTGLGLATVFGIVKQSGGFVDVESELGVGTTFRVVFPATTAEPESAAAPEPAEPLAAVEEHTTLLLVDDEEDIRELATIMLEDRGYRVLSAPNAEEAVVLADKHGDEIRALITDVQMPGMTGVQLAQVLSRRIPDLRILFVSGHSNETISEDVLLDVEADYLQKPYFGDALANKVRQVLTSRRTCLAEPVLNEASPWA